MHRIGSLVRNALLALGAAAPLSQTPAPAPASLDLEALRAALAETSGTRASVAQLAGHARVFGESVEFTFLFDPRGRFLFQTSGRIAIAAALDGDGGWERDLSGAGWKSDLSDLERRKLFYWVMSGRWLERSVGADIRPIDADHKKPELLACGLKLAGGVVEAKVDVDRATHLPRFMTIPDAQGDVEIEFSDWRDGPGILWPHHVVQKEGTGTELVLDFESVGPMPNFIVNPFALADGPPRDVTFSADSPSSIPVESAVSGHLFVKPKVDGRDLGWFILDSGAGMHALSKTSARALALEPFGTRYVIGAGGKSAANFVCASKFELAGATVERPVFVEIDTTGLSQLFGRPIAGIVGADFFRRATVAIDFEAPSVEVFDPSKFELERGHWTPLRFNHRHACVEARFEGDRDAWFVLDTGSGSEVLFHTPAVESLKLLDSRHTVPVSLGGFGGSQSALAGKLAWLELAGRRYEALDAQFATAKTGALADLYTAGVLGGRVLKSRKLVLDYPHSRVAFVERDAKDAKSR